MAVEYCSFVHSSLGGSGGSGRDISAVEFVHFSLVG